MPLEKTKPVIGVDIGGTKIMAAVFDTDGRLLQRDMRPTHGGAGVRQVVGRIGDAIAAVLAAQGLSQRDAGAIGIACAGGIDTGRGVVVTPSPHLPDWVEIPLAAMIRERFGIETCVVNDASAAALGEHRYGAGRSARNIVLFTLGTGIGGGIIIDGTLYLGAVGGAGELGHMTIDVNGPRCGCGNTGCLEILASSTAIAREAVRRLQNGGQSALTAMTGGDLQKITSELVGEAARRGDKLAREVIERAAYYLGVGMVNITNIFNPELIIIGGGMAALGEMIAGQGRKMTAELPFSINARAVRVVMAGLGNEAGTYGAAAYALEHTGGHHESP